jgi:dynein heavy chain, axonemal
MEEEQEEFLHDLANLRNDVSKLKDLLELKNSTKNADTVRRLKISLQQAEEKRKLFNYRESLFNVPETDYKELTDIGRIFDPYFEFWDSAEKWESREKHWTHSVFEELDSDEVECCVSTIVMSLGRASKAFEKDGLGHVNEIVGEVRAYTVLYHWV